MEESPLFNAGRGSVFTSEGTIEMDASIMEGKIHMAGAVAGVSRIKSPIEAAYTVMRKSNHVMLTGKGAEEFARENGLEMANPEYFRTEERYKQWLNNREKADTEGQEDNGMKSVNFTENKWGTVGAVALDKQGNLAAGTSTGGMTNKRYGRVGDSPIIGAGTWADDPTFAVSCTGHGEFFMRYVVAHDIAARMKYEGDNLESAAEKTIEELGQAGGFGGVICLDRKGNIAMIFNTEGMFRGYTRDGINARIDLFGNPDSSEQR